MTAALPTDRQPCRLGPGLEDGAIERALACLGQDPEVQGLVLFGSRARGDARADSDLDLLVIVRDPLTPEREKQLRHRARALLPVDLDLLISDAASDAHWAESRWHVLGHIHHEGVPLDAS